MMEGNEVSAAHPWSGSTWEETWGGVGRGTCGQFPCGYQSCSPLTLYCIHLTAQLDNLSNNQSVW